MHKLIAYCAADANTIEMQPYILSQRRAQTETKEVRATTNGQSRIKSEVNRKRKRKHTFRSRMMEHK